MQKHTHIPALRYDVLTGLYDTVIRFTMPEKRFRERLLAQANIVSGHRVLEIGCGTASLSILAKRLVPEAELVGLDADERVLGIAREKAAKAGVSLTLQRGMSADLPFTSGSFDRVLTCLFFHHLDRLNKELTLEETRRVLRPDGELHVVDWGKASNPLMRTAFLLIQFLDGFESTSDNVRGLLPQMFLTAGFEDVQESMRYATIYGSLSVYSARKPATVVQGV